MKRFVVIFLVVALLLVSGGTVAATPQKLGMGVAAGEHQAAQKGLLGLAVMNLNQRMAELMGLGNARGAIITNVAPGSPAATAGLNIRDIITVVNGTAVANVADLRKALAAADSQVTLTILRDGATQTISVARQPAEQWLVTTGPAWLPELTGIKDSEAFGHFLGTQTSFADKDGKKHTITVTPGIVTEVTEKSLVITPNGQSGPVTFAVTDKTVVRAPGTNLSNIKAGDKVVVTTVDNPQEARLIASGVGIGKRLLGRDGFPGQFHQGAAGGRRVPWQNKFKMRAKA